MQAHNLWSLCIVFGPEQHGSSGSVQQLCPI